jgi:Spy/CpxP family protein refolding chaperone
MSRKHLLKIALIGAVATVLTTWQAVAQTQHDQSYSGLQTREIKAFSREQMEDLSAGRGMGLALAAELNGYPGPRHVLELAGQLSLTDEQRTTIQRLFDSMRAEAIPVGQKLLSAERDLNRAFEERTINPEKLEAMTGAIAEMQGKLRNTHLKYHLATTALLNPDQLRRYSELWGYSDTSPDRPSGSKPMGPAHSMDERMRQHMMGSMHGQ